MKNYGLCRKCFHEDFLYRYAKTRAKILSILPGRNKKLWKRNYEDIFDNYYRIGDHDNSLPENHFMNLRTIITADLVHREDIKELQNGIRHLLKTRRTNRFFNFHTDGLDEICNRLEKMDSTLLSWYEKVDCGIFEFKGHRLESTIDYFTVSICNIDSAYLVLEFSLYLTDEKKNELDKLIKCNYHEDRGYATSTLTARKNRIGSFQNYSVIHYNDDALKADKIYEFISRIEWEFYEALSHYFPFALHKRGIMPPRIALGRQFKELLPILWMKGGAIGKCPVLESEKLPDMLVLPKNKMAVLIDEIFYPEFEQQLAQHPEIQTVFIVTDSEAAYREMIRAYEGKDCYQLYRDYLDNFRINTGR